MSGVTQPGRKVSYERGLLTETSMLSRVGQGKASGRGKLGVVRGRESADTWAWWAGWQWEGQERNQRGKKGPHLGAWAVGRY